MVGLYMLAKNRMVRVRAYVVTRHFFSQRSFFPAVAVDTQLRIACNGKILIHLHVIVQQSRAHLQEGMSAPFIIVPSREHAHYSSASAIQYWRACDM